MSREGAVLYTMGLTWSFSREGDGQTVEPVMVSMTTCSCMDGARYFERHVCEVGEEILS